MNQSADAVPALARKVLDMDITTTVSLLGLLITLAVAVFGTFKYFASEMTSVRNEAQLLVRAVEESESKARHALANSLALSMGRLEADYRLMRDSIGALALDVVRKAEMLGFEARLMQAITTSEARYTQALDKMDSQRNATLSHMEQKLDRLIEGRPNNDRQ